MKTAHKVPLIISALLGLTSVAAGAAFSHLYSSDRAIETALRYHQLYAVMATVSSLLLPFVHPQRAQTMVMAAAWLFIAGTLCFSGGIYAASISQIHALSYATPVGGIILMIGWIALVVAGINIKSA